MGADIIQLRAILGIKLKLDDRKPLTFGRKQKKTGKFNSFFQMLFSFFIGFVYVFPIIGFKDEIFGLFGYFTIFIFLLTFSLITDYANVLIDTRDKYILLPRPIDGRTLFMAKILHLFVYLFRIVLPMALPGWIVLGLNGGWKAAIIFPIPLLLMVFITLFLVNGFYLLILKLAKPEHFQKVLGSFQIAFTIVIVAFYYLLSGVMSSSIIKELNPADYGWIRFSPSYWLAACWTWTGFKTVLPYTQWLSILAIIFPFACLWITVKWLAPQFALKLGAIDSGGELAMPKTKNSNKGPNKKYQTLANAFNRSDAAKAGFMITWLQTARSRTFKMKLYPSLVTTPLYFIFLLSTGKETLADNFNELPQTNKHLLLLYMSAFALLNGAHYLLRSDQYKAAWVYYSAPLETPGSILVGAFKALWLKYFLPFIGLIACFVLYVWGVGAILDIILATINVTLSSLCIMYITAKAFPFSIMEQEKKKDGIVHMFSTLLLIGALGLGHYLAHYFWWLKVIFIVLSSIFFWLVWDSYRNTSWQKIRLAEESL
jgi:hypothetical protein